MAPTSSSTNGHNPPTTPSRDRDRERHPFPQSVHPSPAPIRSSSSSNSSSASHLYTTSLSSASLAAPQSVITVEAVLKNHASSQDPKLAALEQVVAERNGISSQNAQLWKLIEKQRAGYNQIMKELERIRGERDGYKSRLAALTTGIVDKTPKSDRTAKLSQPEHPTRQLSAGSSSSSSRTSQPHRHYSNDDSLNLRTPSLHSSRSHEPLSPRNSDTNLQANAPSTPQRSNSPPPSMPTTTPNTPSTHRTPSRPSPSPLVLPVRNEEPAIPSSAVSISSENAPFSRQVQAPADQVLPNNTPTTAVPSHVNAIRAVYPSRKSSLAESQSSMSGSASQTSVPNPSDSASVATPTIHNYASQVQTSSQKEDWQQESNSSNNPSYSDTTNTHSNAPISTPSNAVRSAPQMLVNPAAAGNNPISSSSLQPPNGSQTYSSTLEPPRHNMSRDSRVTLPDEARQYIVNMTDSPFPSPRMDKFTGPPPEVPTTSASSVDTGGKSEFLDLEDDDDGGSEEEEEGEDDGRNGIDEPQPGAQGPHTPTHANFARPPQPTESRIEATPSRRADIPRVAAEEFPLPPGSMHPSSQTAGQEGSNNNYPSQKNPASSNPTQNPSPSKHSQSQSDQSPSGSNQPPESNNSVRSYGSHQPPTSQNDMRLPNTQSQPIAGSFRALPLLSSDLPYTTIQVSHSFVRPNDRGKEVLSFIVSVNPGHGKPMWKVEKMYSDVLSLDQRVRNAVGKGVGKKIVNLPEGKLWKDHAPARVDQRKAVLEQYLQSLIQLPIKNNDEVIAFFTSDIVRETSKPVMQVGHKEGYLTKRGKNFGGWKTRFFVLQGPVLEYYDCRGGAHLGSIQIAGAQIARQHRTDKSSSTDEEKEYRHAFLIVEAKKGPGGNHPRHVLCAESDDERDAWVELLVRYYTGAYNEELVFNTSSSLSSANSNSVAASYHSSSSPQPRSSTSSSDIAIPAGAGAGGATPRSKAPSRPGLTVDEQMRAPSPSRSVDPSPIERYGPGAARGGAGGAGLPSSLPDPSPLSSLPSIQGANGMERANSELGHYPELQEAQSTMRPNANANAAASSSNAPSSNPNSNSGARQHSPERHRPREPVYEGRQTNYSATNLQPSTSQSATDRAASPDKPDASARGESSSGRVKISGPMHGAPIPQGFKWREPASEPAPSNPDRRNKTKSFWGFVKTNGDKSQTHTFTPRAVFSVQLEESLDVAQICGLPAIVFRCIQYLEAKSAEKEEGIYRLSGSSAVIKSLKDRFNAEGDVDLLASDEYWDPHAIAGLLKSFLRDLPASILTREMHLNFLAVIDLTDPQERIRELSHLIGKLPIANYTLLRALTAHLILIVQNANVNKMTMRNVGIVFSPTLGIPAGVFSLMLGEFNRVFNVELGDAPVEDSLDGADANSKLSSDKGLDPLRRNSKQYLDAAADEYLGLAGRSLKPSTTQADDVQSQSDGDDFSVNDESGTELTTENDGESSSSSPMQEPPDSAVRVTPPDTPNTPTPNKVSKAAHAAASRGLNVTVTRSERGNRHSRLLGLPTSPRPPPSPSRRSPSDGSI